ncbi:5699_t:CDS:2 [Ambispora gerdemannii]|uniref:5699_t:CDS:1 n=1 Tax=Ambispora gerdemannii TaxID=144530 RepID=A0A9N8V6L0_9GLOM|nr:5699_t:CDS:2 [Ambispora gerdemannii]
MSDPKPSRRAMTVLILWPTITLLALEDKKLLVQNEEYPNRMTLHNI